jgi:cytochrome c
LPTRPVIWTGLAAVATIVPAIAGNADTGAELFLTNCQTCHTSGKGEPNRQGPNLWGVVGRAAGTAEGFKYSPALKSAGLVWTPERIDAWLAFPQRIVRGTTMVYRQSDPDKRRTIIEYLAALKD